MAITQVYGAVDAPVFRAQVATAVDVRRAWGDDWIWVPWLYATRASERVSPSTSSASLHFDFGSIKREEHAFFDTYSPLWVNGTYTRIRVYDGYGAQVIWTGMIRRDDVTLHGASNFLSGSHDLPAIGLEHLLDRSIIAGSYTDDGVIDRAVKFNRRGGRGAGTLGNRSDSVDGDGVFVFSGDTNLWTNLEIAQHLLVKHVQGDVTFLLDGVVSALDSVSEVHDFHGASVKQALDTLIDRRRGLGWRVLVWNQNVYVHVFSVLTDSLSVGDVTLPANQDQAIVNTDDVKDVEQSLHFDDLTRYDSVEVQGGPIFSCFSLSYSDSTLEIGWTGAEETAYKNGSGIGDPDASDHDIARRSKVLAPVYRLHRVPSAWDWLAGDGEGGVTNNAAPGVTEDGYPDATILATIWNPGHTLERELPFFEDVDVAGVDPDLRMSFALILDSETRWQYIDQLEDDGTPVSCSYSVGNSEMSVILSPSIAHVMALTHFDPDSFDTNTEPIFDYDTMIATVMVATDTNLKAKVVLDDRGVGDSLLIKMDDAVAWYVVPNTVIDVVDGALVKYSSDGGFERDDSARIRAVAAFAAAWYTQQRSTMTLVIKQISTAMPAGTLVRTAVSNLHVTQVGTVVTDRTWDFLGNNRYGETTIVTGFDEMSARRVAG